MKMLISSAVGMSMLAMAVSGCGTAAGTAVGAGAGAAVGAGVGAVGGAIYDITKKN